MDTSNVLYSYAPVGCEYGAKIILLTCPNEGLAGSDELYLQQLM